MPVIRLFYRSAIARCPLMEEHAHLDAPDESGAWVVQHDVFRPQLLEHAVVLVSEVRPRDDEIFICDEAKVLAEIELVERFLGDVVLDKFCRRVGPSNPDRKAQVSVSRRSALSWSENRAHMLAIALASSSRASGFAPVAAANREPEPSAPDEPEREAAPLLPTAPPPRTRLRFPGGACPRRMSLRRNAALSSPSSPLRSAGVCALVPLLPPAEGVDVLSLLDDGRRSPLLKPGVRRSDVCSLPTCAFQKK